jgi:deoxyribonuclease V
VKLRNRNRWDVDYRAARAIQERLRGEIIRTGSPGKVRAVAGADVSYDRHSDYFHAGVVAMKYPELEIVEEVTASGVSKFPYIPGLLTFREGPILVEAFRRLRTRPDLVIFDGQGVAHPRGIGLAAHMGLIVDVPSIGCAKSRLCGEHAEPCIDVRSSEPLRYEGRVIGRVVRTRQGVKPVYVSVGHRIMLASAVSWVLKCCRGYRLPEPTRQAHHLVNRARRDHNEKRR